MEEVRKSFTLKIFIPYINAITRMVQSANVIE